MNTNTPEDSIQVVIRIRPGEQEDSIITYTQNQIKLDKHQFAFDRIYDPQCSQIDIFHGLGNKLIQNLIAGYNSCLFVYGQTGSGKTYTMMGQNNGIMQQSFRELFSKINLMKNAQFFVTCSYFEIYNQNLLDLLETKKQKQKQKQKKLNIRQDIKKGIFVQNLTEQTIQNSQQLLEVLKFGTKNRHMAQTQMNRTSSRSHSIFTIKLSIKIQENGKKILKTPKIHFVDLAGSQRQKMTMAQGQRLKEAANINKSLSTLGLVINTLTSEKSRTHVPYRDSKLTFILRDSLCGNSKTIIIATISRSLLCFQQTLSTLNFAMRAKMIKVTAQINQQSLQNNVESYKNQIYKLKNQILRLKSHLHPTPIKYFVPQITNQAKDFQYQKHFNQINEKISAISNQLNQGVLSPSLQNLIQNLNKNSSNKIFSKNDPNQMQIQVDNSSYNSEFIQYLNSNYQLLSQIHSKVNNYLQIKEQLKNIVNSKKIQLQEIKTPSKFQRQQYEQLLGKRNQQIIILQKKINEIQNNASILLAEKNALQKSLFDYLSQKNLGQSQILVFKQNLLQTQKRYQLQLQINESLKNNQIKAFEKIQQLEKLLNQTKQLYIYAEDKYQNEKFTSKKLNKKLQSLEQELQSTKKQLIKQKQEKFLLQDKIQNLKLVIEKKQSQQQELINQINLLEQTIQFNQKTLNNLTTKSQKQNIHNNVKYQENSLQKLKQQFNQQKKLYQILCDQKILLIRKISTQNQKLKAQLREIKGNIIQTVLQSEIKNEINKLNGQIMKFKKIMEEKDRTITKNKIDITQFQSKIQLLKKQKENFLQNYNIKYQAKIIQCNMLEESNKKIKAQTQNLLKNLHKKNIQLEQKNKRIQNQKLNYQKLSQKLIQQSKQNEQKILNVQKIISQNQQLKKSYKQLVKQNYKIKGNQNINNDVSQQTDKIKNQQLIAKILFYEQKFKLMSIQYQKTTQVVKKLKERELQKNKKIQFYEQSIRLSCYDHSTDQKNVMINDLKEQNRQLKFKLDNIESNLSKQSIKQKQKSQKQQKINFSQSFKENKLKDKLQSLMKKWPGYKPQLYYCTQQMIELYQKMITQNTIKLQTIAKGIKKQQKLKSQNQFILKQNYYLKQRIQSLEKTLKQSQDDLSKPRKIPKIN